MRVQGTQQHSEKGSILAIMLITSALIGIMLAAYLTLVGSQNRFTQRSQVWNNAIPVCEAGVEEALAHINYSGTTVNFAINGWQLVSGVYVKSRTNEDTRCDMSISTDVQPTIIVRGYVRAPVQANYIGRAVKVKTKINHRFPQAILSKGGISIGGSGKIDSFDSTNSAYSTPSGQYDPAKAHDDATIATLSKTSGALNVGNASVYGKVATGPGGSVVVGNGAVGSEPWVDGSNKGKIQPGYVTDDMNVYIPDAKMPDAWSPLIPAIPLGGVPVGTTTYKYVLPDGDYVVDSINL